MNEPTKTGDKKQVITLVTSLIMLALFAAAPVLWGSYLSTIPSIYDPGAKRNYEIVRYDELQHWVIPLIAFLSYAFMLYRVMRQVAVYDLGKVEELREARFRERVELTVRRRGFILCLVAISAVYILAPFGTFYDSVLSELIPGKPQGVWLAVSGRAVLLISALAILTLSYTSAFGMVLRERRAVRKDKGEKSELMLLLAISVPELIPFFIIGAILRKYVFKGNGENFGFIKRLAIALFTPVVIPPLIICVIIPDLKNLLSLPSLFIMPAVLKIQAVIISVIIAIYVSRIVRAVIKRRAFCRELEALCKSEGFECTPIKRRLVSSFLWMNGESFRIMAHGKTYSCKLIGAMRNKNEFLCLREDGICKYRHPVTFRGMLLFTFETTREFCYEADVTRKILIINPVPQHICKFRRGEWEDADNGDTVNEYKVFAGTAFLRALRADVLDRDVNG